MHETDGDAHRDAAPHRATGASDDDPPDPPDPAEVGDAEVRDAEVRDAEGGECQEALDTLYHFLDGELDEERRRAIQVHLDKCSPCLEAFDFEAELKVVVAQRCRESVPDALRARVADALADASRTFRGPE